MKIPKYVIELMSRAEYEYDRCLDNKNYSVGYTIRIAKATPYTKINTLLSEVKRLVSWANKQNKSYEDVPTAYILFVPSKTHYCKQSAIVTIYDLLCNRLKNT